MPGAVTEEGNTFQQASEADLARFFSYVRKEDDAAGDLERKASGVTFPAGVQGGCWIWAGARDKRTGYGVFRVGDKTFKAHRWFFEQRAGRQVSPKMQVHHLCHDPRVCKYTGNACPHTACVRHTTERSPFENNSVRAKALPPKVTPTRREERVVTSPMAEVMRFLSPGAKVPYQVRQLADLGEWQSAVSRWERENAKRAEAKMAKRIPHEKVPFRQFGDGHRRPQEGPDDVLHDPLRLGDHRWGQCSLVRCLVDYVDVVVATDPVTWMRVDPVLMVPHREVCCKLAAALRSRLPVDLGVYKGGPPEEGGEVEGVWVKAVTREPPEVVRLENQAFFSGPIDAVLNPSGVLWSNGLRDLETEATENFHEVSGGEAERGVNTTLRVIDLNALVVPGAHDEGLPDGDGEGRRGRAGRAPVYQAGEAHDALFGPRVPDELRGGPPLHDGDEGP